MLFQLTWIIPISDSSFLGRNSSLCLSFSFQTDFQHSRLAETIVGVKDITLVTMLPLVDCCAYGRSQMFKKMTLLAVYEQPKCKAIFQNLSYSMTFICLLAKEFLVCILFIY